jgi:hypothetical protein
MNKNKLGHLDIALEHKIVRRRDCIFYGNEEDVRRDVRRCIDATAKGGGFILASSNSIHSIKVENLYTMADEASKYGKYPLPHG